MKTALGCLAHLVAIGVVTFLVDGWVGTGVAPMFRPWAALVAALLLVLGASNFLHLFSGYGQGDASRGTLLARASTGETPTEGGPMLVTGTVRADGPVLHAPLSGAACVAYEYRLYRRRWLFQADRYQTTVYWWGGACRPFWIDTDSRAVRVNGMPDMVDDPAREKHDDTIARARQYVEQTTFEDADGLRLASVAATMIGDRLTDHSTGMRRDWRRPGRKPDIARLRFEEHTVPVGATVAAAGYWSPEQRALGPEPGGLGSAALTITTRSAKALLRRNTALPSSAVSVAVFGVLLLALGAAVLWAMRGGYLG